MKLAIRSVLGLVLLMTCVSVLAADEDPKPLPKLNDLLAVIQAQAAKRMEEKRLAAGAAPVSDVSSQPSNLALRQGAHVQEPSMDDHANAMIEARRAQVPQQVPSFLMRADGRPLGAGSFSGRSSSFGGDRSISEIVGCLKVDCDSDDVPQFKVYFEGMETTNNDEGFFKFPVDDLRVENCVIIICNKIMHSFGKRNTVDSFGLIPDMNYKYFHFNQNKWIEQDRALHKKNLRIPRNAIVVTLNPAYFDRLETEWTGDFGSRTLKLPRIVLKAGKRSKLERKAVKSLLYGLDMSPFHTDVKYVGKEIGDGKGEVSVRFAK